MFCFIVQATVTMDNGNCRKQIHGRGQTAMECSGNFCLRYLHPGEAVDKSRLGQEPGK